MRAWEVERERERERERVFVIYNTHTFVPLEKKRFSNFT
jgi:hypothetical protein